MSNIRVPVDGVVLRMSVRKMPDETAISVVGWGTSTSIRSMDCHIDHMAEEFASVLLFANGLDDTDENVKTVVNAIKQKI